LSRHPVLYTAGKPVDRRQ